MSVYAALPDNLHLVQGDAQQCTACEATGTQLACFRPSESVSHERAVSLVNDWFWQAVYVALRVRALARLPLMRQRPRKQVRKLTQQEKPRPRCLSQLACIQILAVVTWTGSRVLGLVPRNPGECRVCRGTGESMVFLTSAVQVILAHLKNDHCGACAGLILCKRCNGTGFSRQL